MSAPTLPFHSHGTATDEASPVPAQTHARIDTIKVTFDYDRLPEPVAAGRWVELDRGARLGVYRGSQRAWLEFSAPRVVHGHNLTGLGAGRLVEALEKVLADAEGHGLRHRLACVGEARVRRLDLCRDFADAFEAAHLMEALSRQGFSKRVTVELVMSEGAASGLVLRNGSWRMILYNKSLEHAKKHECREAIPDVMRFEAQLKADGIKLPWVQAHGKLDLVADITPKKVEAWARAAFERNHFDTPVLRRNSIVDAVKSMGMNPNRSLLTLGAMAAIGAGDGLNWSGYAPSTQEELVRTAAKAGVISDGVSRSVQLDWESDRIVSLEFDGIGRTANTTRMGTPTPDTLSVSRTLGCGPRAENVFTPPRLRPGRDGRALTAA